jgi:hypothetical protein
MQLRVAGSTLRTLDHQAAMPDCVDLSDRMDLIALGQASQHDLLADKGCGSRRPSGGSLAARAKVISHNDEIGFTELIRLAYQ